MTCRLRLHFRFESAAGVKGQNCYGQRLKDSAHARNLNFCKHTQMMSASDSAEESGQSTPGRDSEFESRGSSVSTGLREEYEDLLRYAIVAPTTSGMMQGMSMKGGGARPASSASAHATAYAAPFSRSAGRRVESKFKSGPCVVSLEA